MSFRFITGLRTFVVRIDKQVKGVVVEEEVFTIVL